MKAPKVNANIAANEAREQLQFALDHIAEIYTIIGELPYYVTKEEHWQVFVKMYDNGPRRLDDLATDPIPF